MKKLSVIMLSFVLIFCAGNFSHADEEETLQTDLSALPEEVLAAAQEAKPDIKITGYYIEWEAEQLVYELEGFDDDVCYEIEVSAEGKVLEIEECD